MSCAQCDELREEIAYLKSELGLNMEMARIHAVQQQFSLTTNEARLLLALFDASPRGLNRIQAFESMEHSSDEVLIKAVDVYVHRLRQKLGFEAIETIWGIGHTLSAATTTLIKEVLA